MVTDHTGGGLSSEELNRYIQQTIRIRELSSPQASSLSSADDYRRQLLENFSLIGSLAQENTAILNTHFFPAVQSDHTLDADTRDVMRSFSQGLSNAYSVSSSDISLVYRQTKCLLQAAEDAGDDEQLIAALDSMVEAAYFMIGMTANLSTRSRIHAQSYADGWAAGEKLLAYLQEDRFAKLSDTSKELVLINARFIRVLLSLIPGGDLEDLQRKDDVLQLMIHALELSENPFFQQQLPSYNWHYHNYRTLQYIASLTDCNNSAGYDKKALALIDQYTKQLADMEQHDPICATYPNTTQELPVYQSRNAYLSGACDLNTYKQTLRDIFDSAVRQDFSEGMPTMVMTAPLEYILLLDANHLAPEDAAFLTRFYTKLADLVHRAPKQQMFSFILANASLLLNHFIDVPGGVRFEDLCLSIIAALHPPTYVHTLSVASFATYLTRHLIIRKPELFLGVLHCTTTRQVLECRDDIEHFVYHGALCHDFGKLLIAETIMTYGRSLLDEEFDLIRIHPEIGAQLLERHPDTAPYRDIALGHHKWFHGQGGYPASFDIDASPLKNIIAIITCADCLDASTDTVGRSYKRGKTLEHFLEELRAESGTRYAAWLIDLFEDHAIYQEIERLLLEGRDENYRKTYRILKSSPEDMGD